MASFFDGVGVVEAERLSPHKRGDIDTPDLKPELSRNLMDEVCFKLKQWRKAERIVIPNLVGN
jgi:hypothetical protein